MNFDLTEAIASISNEQYFIQSSIRYIGPITQKMLHSWKPFSISLDKHEVNNRNPALAGWCIPSAIDAVANLWHHFDFELLIYPYVKFMSCKYVIVFDKDLLYYFLVFVLEQ